MIRTIQEHEERLANYRRIHKESADRLCKIEVSIFKLQSQITSANAKGLKKFDEETYE